MPRRRPDGFVMISFVAERYDIHPQTLRLYEREGLPDGAPVGNTRLYGPDEIRTLEMILNAHARHGGSTLRSGGRSQSSAERCRTSR